MALYRRGASSDFWRQYYQRRGITGSSLTPGQTRSLVNPILESDYATTLALQDRADRRDRFNQEMDLRKQQIEKADRAARASGAFQTVGAGVNLGIADKYLGLVNPAPGLAPGATDYGLSAIQPLTPPPAQLTGSLVGGAGSGGAPVIGGAGGGGATIPATPSLTAAPAATSPALTTPPSAGLGWGAALPAASSALIGAGAGGILASTLNANEDISQGLTLAGAGAGIGAYFGGPAGAVVGAGVGAVVSLFDDIF